MLYQLSYASKLGVTTTPPIFNAIGFPVRSRLPGQSSKDSTTELNVQADFRLQASAYSLVSQNPRLFVFRGKQRGDANSSVLCNFTQNRRDSLLW